MSPNFQPEMQLDPHPGLHPDAEALNAFAEQALPDPERAQILAHAAQCSRCRQVLFLALQAAEPSAPASERAPFLVTKTRVIPIRFANWRFAGAAAAAAFALAALSLFLLPKHTQPSPQVAKQELPKVTPPPRQTAANSPLPPANRPGPARPLASSKAAVSLGSATARPTPAQPANDVSALRDSAGMVAASPAPPPRQSVDAASPAQPPIPSPAAAQPVFRASARAPYPVAGSVSETVTVEAAPPIDAPQPSITETLGKQKVEAVPNPNPPQLQIELSASARAVQTEPDRKQRSAAGSFAKSAKAAPAGQTAGAAQRTASGTGNGSGAGASSSIHGMAVDSLSAAIGALDEDPKADLEAARKALHATLPSGSTAVSTAAARHLLLAIDAAGALFLSGDEGTTWQPVPQQWTGRAAELHVKPAPVPIVRPGAGAGSPLPATLSRAFFELVTDSGASWTSADGKTWVGAPANSPPAK